MPFLGFYSKAEKLAKEKAAKKAAERRAEEERNRRWAHEMWTEKRDKWRQKQRIPAGWHASPRPFVHEENEHGEVRRMLAPRQAHLVQRSPNRVPDLNIVGSGVPVRKANTKLPAVLDSKDKTLQVFRDLKKENREILKGAGSFMNTIMYVTPTPHALGVLAELQRRMSNELSTGIPVAPGKTLVVKIGQGYPELGAEHWQNFLKDSIRENSAHIALQKVAPALVPRFYFSGSLGARYYVTVMEKVDGVTLEEYTKQHGGNVSMEIFNRVKHAVATVLHAGIVHGDLHDNNIMITPRGDVKIIDFGFAVQLSPEQIAEVRKHVHRDPIEAWSHIGPYVNAVQAQRGHSRYNPNVKALQVLRSLVYDKVDYGKGPSTPSISPTRRPSQRK